MARPVWPVPTRPSAAPFSPRASEYRALSQRPRLRSATLSGMWRSSETISPKASSATAAALLPGQFATSMPSRVAASTSIVLKPAPARTTRFSEPARSVSAVTRVLRTTRTSAPVSDTAAVRAWPRRSGSATNLNPGVPHERRSGIGDPVSQQSLHSARLPAFPVAAKWTDRSSSACLCGIPRSVRSRRPAAPPTGLPRYGCRL